MSRLGLLRHSDRYGGQHALARCRGGSASAEILVPDRRSGDWRPGKTVYKVAPNGDAGLTPPSAAPPLQHGL